MYMSMEERKRVINIVKRYRRALRQVYKMSENDDLSMNLEVLQSRQARLVHLHNQYLITKLIYKMKIKNYAEEGDW